MNIQRLKNKKAIICTNDNNKYFGIIFNSEVIVEDSKLAGYISLEQMPNDNISSERYGKTSLPIDDISSISII